MTDTSQGDGWWEASNHKWYPPERHDDPAHRARYAPSDAPGTRPDAEPVNPPEPDTEDLSDLVPEPTDVPTSVSSPPSSPPTSVPVSAPTEPPKPKSDGPDLDPLADGPKQSLLTNPWLWISMVAFLVVALVAIAIVSLWGGDSDDEPATSDSAAATSTEAGASASSAPQEQDPVGFGQVNQWEGWRATVIDLVDAEADGLLASFSDPPSAGNVFIAVIYEVTYTGNETTAFEPFIVDASTSETRLEPFACFLDDAALTAIGVETFVFELVPGQTTRLADCFAVAESDVDEVVVTIESAPEFDSAVVFERDGESLPVLDPVTVAPDYSDLVTQPFGFLQTWVDWRGGIIEVLDAEDSELLSDFSEPPRDGFTYMALISEVTYTGTEGADFNALQVAALGSGVFDTFSNCILSTDLLQARGLDVGFEFAPGQTATVAQCVEVPNDELDSLIYRMINTFDFDADPVYYTAD